MQLYLTILDDNGEESYSIGTFDHVEDLREWTKDVKDEDVFVDE